MFLFFTRVADTFPQQWCAGITQIANVRVDGGRRVIQFKVVRSWLLNVLIDQSTSACAMSGSASSAGITSTSSACGHFQPDTLSQHFCLLCRSCVTLFEFSSFVTDTAVVVPAFTPHTQPSWCPSVLYMVDTFPRWWRVGVTWITDVHDCLLRPVRYPVQRRHRRRLFLVAACYHWPRSLL